MNRSPDLNALRTFRLVVDTGDFTAAAHRSHRAVSLVSRQIAALERSVGQALFHRHTRAGALTGAGARYIQAIRPLLAELDEARQAISTAHDEPAGVLAINAPVAFGERRVVPLIQSPIGLRYHARLVRHRRGTFRRARSFRSLAWPPASAS